MNRWKMIFLIGLWGGCGCAVSMQRKELAPAKKGGNEDTVPAEYRLEADRQSLSDLRKEIPEEQRHENDEKAVLAELMGKVDKHPSEVREKYNQLTQKKRDSFNKEMTKARDVYVSEERKRRDQFLSSLQKERENFAKKKTTREEKKDFYDQLFQKRQEFFASERENRGEFESDFQNRRKNFDDYMRERNQNFNEQHRAYYKAWDEKLKVDKMKKNQTKAIEPASPVLDSTSDEFSQIPQGPGIPLGAQEN